MGSGDPGHIWGEVSTYHLKGFLIHLGSTPETQGLLVITYRGSTFPSSRSPKILAQEIAGATGGRLWGGRRGSTLENSDTKTS